MRSQDRYSCSNHVITGTCSRGRCIRHAAIEERMPPGRNFAILPADPESTSTRPATAISRPWLRSSTRLAQQTGHCARTVRGRTGSGPRANCLPLLQQRIEQKLASTCQPASFDFSSWPNRYRRNPYSTVPGPCRCRASIHYLSDTEPPPQS